MLDLYSQSIYIVPAIIDFFLANATMADISGLQSRIKTIEQGPHLWTAPLPAEAPTTMLYVVAAISISFGALIGVAAFEVVRGSWHPWREPAVWISVGIPVGLFAFAGYLIYSARHAKKPEGIRFYLRGVEVGEGSKRKLIRYSDLESFTCVLNEPNNGVDTALFALRTVVSIAAMNPAGLGRAMGEMNQQPIHSHLTIKPRDSDPLIFPLSLGDHRALAAILPKSPDR